MAKYDDYIEERECLIFGLTNRKDVVEFERTLAAHNSVYGPSKASTTTEVPSTLVPPANPASFVEDGARNIAPTFVPTAAASLEPQSAELLRHHGALNEPEDPVDLAARERQAARAAGFTPGARQLFETTARTR